MAVRACRGASSSFDRAISCLQRTAMPCIRASSHRELAAGVPQFQHFVHVAFERKSRRVSSSTKPTFSAAGSPLEELGSDVRRPTSKPSDRKSQPKELESQSSRHSRPSIGAWRRRRVGTDRKFRALRSHELDRPAQLRPPAFRGTFLLTAAYGRSASRPLTAKVHIAPLSR